MPSIQVSQGTVGVEVAIDRELPRGARATCASTEPSLEPLPTFVCRGGPPTLAKARLVFQSRDDGNHDARHVSSAERR